MRYRKKIVRAHLEFQLQYINYNKKKYINFILSANLHVAKTIELSRIHLFNIITQYKAMFNDDELIIPGRDLTLNESAIFYHWLEEKVNLRQMRYISRKTIIKRFLTLNLFSDIAISRYARTRFTGCDVYRLHFRPVHVLRIVIWSSGCRLHRSNVGHICSSYR